MRRPPAGCTSSSREPCRRGSTRGPPRERGRPCLDWCSLPAGAGAPDGAAARPSSRGTTRARLVGAHLPLELDRRPRRIEPAIVASERSSQRRDGLRAAARAGATGEPAGERLDSSAAATIGERAPRAPAPLSVPSAARARRTSGPVSRPSSIRIRRHAGLGVPGQDRGRDRRRAAMARQQRGVQVEGAVARQRQAAAAGTIARSRPAR